MKIINLWKNKFCKFLLWEKIIFSFVCYFTIIVFFVILGWLLIITSLAKTFFNSFNLNFTINLLNNPDVQQTFLLNGIFNIVALIGFFSLFCYIFYQLSEHGIKNAFPGEEKKIFPVVFYLLIISAILSGSIIFSYIQGNLGSFSIPRDIEVFCLAFSLVFLLWSSIILNQIFPKRYEDYSELIILLDKTLLFKNYEFTSMFFFFLMIGLPIFGLILGFNIVSIICLDLMLMFMVGILGAINSLPLGLANIKLKSGDSISNIYILNLDQNFITFLQEDNKTRKLTLDSIESYGEEKLEVDFNIDNLTQTIANLQISQHQNCEIINYCPIMSKMTDVFVVNSCIWSILMGMFLHPIVNIYRTLGINWATFIANCILIFILITIPTTSIIYSFFNLKNPVHNKNFIFRIFEKIESFRR